MVDQEKADQYVHAVVKDWRSAPLTAVDRALCQFAAKLTRLPQAISEADINALREQGLDDSAIHDAVQVIGYFNYITRVAEGLGVENEPFIQPWGAQ